MLKKIEIVVSVFPDFSGATGRDAPEIFRLPVFLPGIPRVGEKIAFSFRRNNGEKVRSFFSVNDISYQANSNFVICYINSLAKTKESYEASLNDLHTIKEQTEALYQKGE